MGDLFNPPRLMPLRIYQEMAISKMRDSVHSGNRRIVLQLPTGAGKTLIAARIVRSAVEKRQRVLFIAPSRHRSRGQEAPRAADCSAEQGGHA